MDASIEAVYGDIVFKAKKFVVEEGGDEIIVSGPQKFFYYFSDTIGEGHGSNRGNVVLNLRTGQVPVPPATDKVIYYLTVIEKIGFSMLYLILTLMLGVGCEEA